MALPGMNCLQGSYVALPLIPESIGFSIIAGVDPRVGLYASVAIAMVVAFTGGRPRMILAATAIVAVLVIPLVRDHGVEYLFAANILMGLIQIVGGLARLDLLMHQDNHVKDLAPKQVQISHDMPDSREARLTCE